MSYEGFEQLLCSQGHYWSKDAFDYTDVVCPKCNEDAIWWNAVDQTNGSFDDDGTRIDGYVELELKTPVHTCQCSTCGDVHSARAATYKLPANGIGHHGKVPRNLIISQ